MLIVHSAPPPPNPTSTQKHRNTHTYTHTHARTHARTHHARTHHARTHAHGYQSAPQQTFLVKGKQLHYVILNFIVTGCSPYVTLQSLSKVMLTPKIHDRHSHTRGQEAGVAQWLERRT